MGHHRVELPRHPHRLALVRQSVGQVVDLAFLYLKHLTFCLHWESP